MQWLLWLFTALGLLVSPQEQNQYVGPAPCASCHPEISESFKSVSMSATFGPISQVPRLEDWSTNNRFEHKASRQIFVMTARNGKFYQRRYQLDAAGRETNSFEQEIHFAIGSGRKERDYLYRSPSGELLQLPVVWYSDEKAWGMAPGYDRPDHDNFSRRVVYRCFFCHNAYPELPAGAARYEAQQALYPGLLPQGIDCERCHGPGGLHARTASASAIVNPANLSRKLQMDVCMQCHLETTSESLPNSVLKLGRSAFSFRPGEPLEDYAAYFDYGDPKKRDAFNIVHQAYRLRQSKCFQESSMTCTTCHDPHRSEADRAGSIRAKCSQCHSTVKAHGEDCLNCHMPQRRTDDVVHVVMTDHFIQRRIPGDLLKPKPEPAHTPFRGSLSFYLPEPASELYLGIALVRGADAARGIALLERAAQRPSFELAGAYAATGAHDKAVREFEAGLRSDPIYAEGWYNLGMSLLALNRLAAARSALVKAVGLNGALADAQVGIGLVDIREGRPESAREAYLAAIQIDPMNYAALMNLAVLERQSGNASIAGRYFEAALRIRPGRQ